MSNGDAGQSASGHIKTELAKDDLLKYVELDLWSRFQERLWRVVGIVLTLFTIASLFGIPYYIDNEVSAHLREREKEFTDKTDEIVAYSKLLALLGERYDSERYRFDADVLHVISALEEEQRGESNSEPKQQFKGLGGFGDPSGELTALISRKDFSQLIEGSFTATQLFYVPKNLDSKRIVPPTIITVENKGPSGSGSYRQTHPVRDGTYKGILKDLKFRIVVLEALRRSIQAMQEDMLALGGNSALGKRVESVRVSSIEATAFHDIFSKDIASVANSFLDDSERKEFASLQGLYDIGYKTNYEASNTAAPAGQKAPPSIR